jgi:hypothetical protein
MWYAQAEYIQANDWLFLDDITKAEDLTSSVVDKIHCELTSCRLSVIYSYVHGVWVDDMRIYWSCSCSYYLAYFKQIEKSSNGCRESSPEVSGINNIMMYAGFNIYVVVEAK